MELIFLFPPKFEFVFYDIKFEMYKKGKLVRTVLYKDIKEVTVLNKKQNNIIINCSPIGINIYNVSNDICNKVKDIIRMGQQNKNYSTNDILISSHDFLNYGTFYLFNDNIDEFLNMINVNKDNISFNNVDELINELISKEYII